MDGLKILLCDEPITYDGTQLNSHWIYRTFEQLGHAIVSFQGPAQVTLDQMVDLEDVKQKAPIYSPNMLHFIGEWFYDSLNAGILLQHLFVCEVYESLLENGIASLSREGNDIFYQRRKLSVSICTKSPTSILMHMGLNIDTEGTPIPTSGLKEMGVNPMVFAKSVLDRLECDFAVWQRSRMKVRAR